MFMSVLGAKSAAPLVLKGLVRLTSKILQALRGSLLVRIDPWACGRESSTFRMLEEIGKPVPAAGGFNDGPG